MNETIFRILAAAIILSTASISIYYRRRAQREGGDQITLQEEGRLLAVSLRLLGLGMWGGVFAWMINPAWMSWSHFDLPEWARWLGVLMGAAAVLLAYWVFSNLGNNVTPTVVTRARATLVTSGPYRWVRHPLYSMGVLALLGFTLLSENWYIALQRCWPSSP
jgi:protein-S-isoprenylcysteine O-methyltransferase Ste14